MRPLRIALTSAMVPAMMAGALELAQDARAQAVPTSVCYLGCPPPDFYCGPSTCGTCVYTGIIFACDQIPPGTARN